MRSWMKLAAAGSLLAATAGLAAWHATEGALPWFDWLASRDASLIVWGITLRLIGLVNVICFVSLWPQVRVAGAAGTGVVVGI